MMKATQKPDLRDEVLLAAALVGVVALLIQPWIRAYGVEMLRGGTDELRSAISDITNAARHRPDDISVSTACYGGIGVQTANAVFEERRRDRNGIAVLRCTATAWDTHR